MQAQQCDLFSAPEVKNVIPKVQGLNGMVDATHYSKRNNQYWNGCGRIPMWVFDSDTVSFGNYKGGDRIEKAKKRLEEMGRRFCR